MARSFCLLEVAFPFILFFHLSVNFQISCRLVHGMRFLKKNKGINFLHSTNFGCIWNLILVESSPTRRILLNLAFCTRESVSTKKHSPKKTNKSTVTLFRYKNRKRKKIYSRTRTNFIPPIRTPPP